MRLPRGSLVIPCGLLLLVVALLALHTSTETSCDGARDQLSNGFVDRAEKAFNAILVQDPGSGCAAAGMNTVVAKRCKEAETALRSGLRAQAAKGYVAILVTRPKEQCALDGVKAAAVAMCLRAAELARTPETADAAAKAYATSLAIEPSPSPELCPVASSTAAAGAKDARSGTVAGTGVGR